MAFQCTSHCTSIILSKVKKILELSIYTLTLVLPGDYNYRHMETTNTVTTIPIVIKSV